MFLGGGGGRVQDSELNLQRSLPELSVYLNLLRTSCLLFTNLQHVTFLTRSRDADITT